MNLSDLNKNDDEWLSDDYCSCCRNERLNTGKAPRVYLTVQVPESKEPYKICSFCDGDALILAKVLEAERLSG